MNETAEKESRRRTSRSRRLEVALSIRGSDYDRQLGDSLSSLELRRSLSNRSGYVFNQRVPTDWDQQAVCAFFHDYVLYGLGDGRGGYLDFLPELYREQSDTPYFAEALAAVSMASFANRTSMEHLVLRARKSYGRTLSLINKALDDKAEAKSDRLLTSLFLLNKYENISGDKPTMWESHGKGQMELIRLRGLEQFSTSRGRNLYRLIHFRQRVQDLAFRREPTNPLNAASEAFNPAAHAAKLAGIVSRVKELQSLVPPVSEPGLQHSGWDLLALDLQQEMQRWSDASPEPFRYWSLPPCESLPFSDLDATSIYPKGIFVFKSVQTATVWNVFWCGQIVLLQTMLEYRYGLSAEEYDRSPLPSRYGIYQSLQDAVDNVCATVPFLLGEIDSKGALNTQSQGKAIGGYNQVWSLHVAGSVNCLSPAREAWISDRLLHIGNVFGIKQALVLRQYRETERAGRYRHAVMATHPQA